VGRRCALLLAAALVGAGGLAGEAILLSAAGLALGFGRASALGLSLFVAGYGLGAWSGGRRRWDSRAALLVLAAAALLLPWVCVQGLRLCTAAGWSTLAAGSLAAVALAAAGFVQGALLPALLRLDPLLSASRGVALVFAANLGGSIAGAQAIGFEAVAHFGRSRSALIAGSAAALGALLCAALAPKRAAPEPADAPESQAADVIARPNAALLAGLGTAWVIAVEWIGLRHTLLWLESQQATLAAVLGASLCALTIGALIALGLPRGRAGVMLLIPFAVAGCVWLSIGAPWLHARVGDSRFLFALGLLGPALAPLGAWIPALYRASAGEAGARVGRLVLHETWGAMLLAPLAHFLLVPRFGLAGALAVLAGCGALLALIANGKERRRALPTALIVGCCCAAASLLVQLGEPALRSPLYTDPALSVRSFREDAQFAVGVVDDGVQGERTLLTDRFRAAGTGRDYAYMRALGHLPLLLHPRPARVAVMCLGTGTTLGAASLHPQVERLEVMEISAAVIAAAPWFTSVHQGALEAQASGRALVHQGDGRRLLADRPASFDVVTMEPLLPDSPFGVYLYTREFYASAARALAPGGLLCQWIPPHALEPAVFEALLHSFSASFPWSGRFLFGSQLLLIGAQREPQLDPRRFPDPHSALGRELARVNLHEAGGVLASFRGATPWPAGPRELCDDDAWIVYLDKPTDARVLGWLGENLGLLQQRAAAPPAAWSSALGARAQAFERAGRLLLDARIEAARFEARLRLGGAAADELLANSSSFEALAQCEEAGELGRALLDEQRYLALLREGVAAIPRDPRRAADRLLSAAELRPERADAQLYVAAALQAVGDAGAAHAALARAMELCPRALETPAGLRATKLGLRAPR